jgi:hypothetical protein
MIFYSILEVKNTQKIPSPLASEEIADDRSSRVLFDAEIP